MIFSNAMQTRSPAIFTQTTLAPAGVVQVYDIKMPMKKQIISKITEKITTVLNLVQTLIEESDGITIKLEIKSVPTSFIPRTIVTAVKMAITVL